MELNERQDRALIFINEYQQEHGWPPSVREIATAIGTSSTSVTIRHLESLVRKGAIKRGAPKKVRTIAIAPDGAAYLEQRRAKAAGA